MFQSKWFRVFKKIILIWMLITLYFYFQQPVTYRFTGLNASFPIGEDQLVINEISVNNLDKEELAYLYNDEIPWQYRMLETFHVPWQCNNPIIKVISFYSRPPLSKEYGYLNIYGTYILAEPISDMDLHELHELMYELHEHMDVNIYPGLATGMELTTANNKNAIVISTCSKYPLKDLDKPFLLKVTDKAISKTTSLLITPQWQKERFKRFPGLKNPADPVSEYINRIYQSEAQKASKNSNNANLKAQAYLADKAIQIETKLKWIDIYEDYFGVYQVEADIYECIESSNQRSGAPDQITFYTHQNNEGDFEVINYKLEQVRSKD